MEAHSQMDVDGMEDEELVLKPRGLCGLANIGNTCYMNSALQALSNCPQVTQFFLKCDDFIRMSEGDKPSVAICYMKLIKEMWDNGRPNQVTPTALSRAIKVHNPTFRGYSQQDTQELLRCLMDRLHEELKRPVYNVHQECGIVYLEPESQQLHQKRLLGGNGSSDDSLEDEVIVADDVQGHGISLSTHPDTCSAANERGRSRRTKSSSKSLSKDKQIDPQDVEYHSIITDVFDGKLLSSVQCLTCNRKSNRIETFQDLSLPIPGIDDVSRIHHQALRCNGNADAYTDTGWMNYMWMWMKSWFVGPEIQLQDCLAAFFTSDELQGDNMYYCEKCKKLRNGVKFSRVRSLPEILCIHLKRFRHEMVLSSKIHTYVSFPLYGLQMEPFLSKEALESHSSCSYNLTAVITHFGGVGAGHYIAYAKNCVSNKWYEFNDSFVNEVSESAVSGAEAYVLFYSKCSVESDRFRRQLLADARSLPGKHTQSAVLVSKEWFTRLETCVDPGPISNFDLLCRHGALDLENSKRVHKLVVRVERSVWNVLHARFGGGPELNVLKECPICRELQERRTFEFDTFSKLHEAFQCGIDDFEVGFPLSMAWYNRWEAFVKGRAEDPPGEISNLDLIEDGTTTLKGDANFGYVSEQTWMFLHERYGGGPALPVRRSHKGTSDAELQVAAAH